MRGGVRGIEANSSSLQRPPGPDAELAWFTVSIGPVGEPSTDLFQVAVATPQGISGRRDRRRFVGLVVDRFESAEIERVIREFVASIEGLCEQEVAERLGRVMHWESAGYRA